MYKKLMMMVTAALICGFCFAETDYIAEAHIKKIINGKEDIPALKVKTVTTDTISERTSGSGVSVDSVLLKDGIPYVVNTTLGFTNQAVHTSGSNTLIQVGYATNNQAVTFTKQYSTTPFVLVTPYGTWGEMITNAYGTASVATNGFTIVVPDGVFTGYWFAVGSPGKN